MLYSQTSDNTIAVLCEDSFDLEKTLECGQTFSWVRVGEKAYAGTHLNHTLIIKQYPDRSLELACSRDEFEHVWKDYFDLDTDYDAMILNLDLDIFARLSYEHSKGIHILKQDPWETLITFITSQNNNLARIERTIAGFRERYGLPIISNGIKFHSFPRPEILRNLTISDLENLGLGYRAEYVKTAIGIALGNTNYLENLKKETDSELLTELREFPGIGPKVASCVALFAYHRLNTFPVDTWIDKIRKTYYNGKFDLNRYTPYAGLIQQYMFYYERMKGSWQN